MVRNNIEVDVKVKCIEKGKEAGIAPVSEKKIWTNFIR